MCAVFPAVLANEAEYRKKTDTSRVDGYDSACTNSCVQKKGGKGFFGSVLYTVCVWCKPLRCKDTTIE